MRGGETHMPFKEKRASERVACCLDASIISEMRIYNGFIKNVSENGLEYFTTSSLQLPEGTRCDRKLHLIFSIFSDEVIRLDCIPRWYEAPRSEDYIVIGLKIMDPSPRYHELIRNFHLCKYL